MMSNNKPCIPDGKKSGMVPERKNFTQACNLLNKYLKEKGSLRDLNINGKLDSIGKPGTSKTSTVDFLRNMEHPSPAPSPAPVTPIAMLPEKSLPPLPQYIDVESYIAKKASSSEQATTAEAAKTAAMTIIYGGQVMVFNDISEEKVRELMMFANKTVNGTEKIDRGKAPVTAPVNSVSIVGSQEQQQPRLATIVEASGSDLPIARRASLHKFLAKRKDRATARAAPYQAPTSFHQKDEPKFDLNL